MLSVIFNHILPLDTFGILSKWSCNIFISTELSPGY